MRHVLKSEGVVAIFLGKSGNRDKHPQRQTDIMKMNIETERVYDAAQKPGSYRVLVDRLWPRGRRKDELELDIWLKDIAPSNELRKWFAHDPTKWQTFKQRYFQELESKQELLNQLFAGAQGRPIVLLYGARDTEHNQALALKEYIEQQSTTGSLYET